MITQPLDLIFNLRDHHIHEIFIIIRYVAAGKGKILPHHDAQAVAQLIK